MTIEELGAIVLALILAAPASVWWALGLMVVGVWVMGLSERSYEDYDPATNTFKRNNKRDFPRLFLWLHGLLSAFCAFVLAPIYGWGWLIGALIFAQCVWVNRHIVRHHEDQKLEEFLKQARARAGAKDG